MGSKNLYSLKVHLLKTGLTLIFVTQKEANSGFYFLIDTSVKDNYIDQFYLDFYNTFYGERDINPFGIDEISSHKQSKTNSDFFKFLGTKKVISRKLIKEELKVYEIGFKFCSNTFVDKFFISNVAEEFQKWNKKYQIAGILGNKFLIKYKWIIDYDLKQIYSKQSIIK